MLEVVVALLALPYPKIPRRACDYMLTMVTELLGRIIRADTYDSPLHRILKLAGVALRLLLPRVWPLPLPNPSPPSPPWPSLPRQTTRRIP